MLTFFSSVPRPPSSASATSTSAVNGNTVPSAAKGPSAPATVVTGNGVEAGTTKPFRCSHCQKEFSHLSSLESHLDHMHSDLSKHVCENCGKNFSSKSNLTAHKKIHSGEIKLFYPFNRSYSREENR